MSVLFSFVRASTPDGKAVEFLVRGIPRVFDDLFGYTAFDRFLDDITEGDTEVTVHADAYLYGNGETYKASLEEVAYFTLRMSKDEAFLCGHCDKIESVDFTFDYSPEPCLRMGWW